MTPSPQKYGFIGCGNMAKALIQGLLADSVAPENIWVSCPQPEKHKAFAEQTQINMTRDSIVLAQQALTMILAVKPQVIPQVLDQLSQIDLSEHSIISIAAGINCDTIEKRLQQPVAIIRAMPNTPAAIQQAATGLFANTRVNTSQKIVAKQLFSAVGQFAWVELESQIDLVTAIAGSSPAYCFMFIQAMVEQAEDLGMPESVARQLATQSMLGAAKLVQTNTSQELQQLIDAVTSKGGTTEAAIASLKQNKFSDSIKEAVKSAYQRAQQLGDTQ